MALLAATAACTSGGDAGGVGAGGTGTPGAMGGVLGGGGAAGGSLGGSGGVPGGGSIDGIWTPASATVQAIDLKTGVKSATLTAPLAPLPWDDGRPTELYEEIRAGTLYVYGHVQGDNVYYRMQTPLVHVGDGYSATMGGGTSHAFLMKDGALTETSFAKVGATNFVVSAKLQRYGGAFPPAGWPAQAVDLPMPGTTAQGAP